MWRILAHGGFILPVNTYAPEKLLQLTMPGPSAKRHLTHRPRFEEMAEMFFFSLGSTPSTSASGHSAKFRNLTPFLLRCVQMQTFLESVSSGISGYLSLSSLGVQMQTFLESVSSGISGYLSLSSMTSLAHATPSSCCVLPPSTQLMPHPLHVVFFTPTPSSFHTLFMLCSSPLHPAHSTPSSCCVLHTYTQLMPHPLHVVFFTPPPSSFHTLFMLCSSPLHPAHATPSSCCVLHHSTQLIPHPLHVVFFTPPLSSCHTLFMLCSSPLHSAHSTPSSCCVLHHSTQLMPHPLHAARMRQGHWHLRLVVITMFCLFQDDHRAFRRQLEDKRPVVENNLLSGRQYIANEPPLSDTSDSEGG
uniref:Uncharacterized protein n=1 Tax=Timema tahoe TaxID=61484 RepID=A0A7R9IDB4_9NEOP|nr:unnamed protein product [Timema tahoe]